MCKVYEHLFLMHIIKIIFIFNSFLNDYLSNLYLKVGLDGYLVSETILVTIIR